jgi:hypothetical protein
VHPTSLHLQNYLRLSSQLGQLPRELRDDKTSTMRQSTTEPKATPFHQLACVGKTNLRRTTKPLGEINGITYAYLAGIDLIRPNVEVRQLCLPIDRGKGTVHRKGEGHYE